MGPASKPGVKKAYCGKQKMPAMQAARPPARTERREADLPIAGKRPAALRIPAGAAFLRRGPAVAAQARGAFRAC